MNAFRFAVEGFPQITQIEYRRLPLIFSALICV